MVLTELLYQRVAGSLGLQTSKRLTAPGAAIDLSLLQSVPGPSLKWLGDFLTSDQEICPVDRARKGM